MTLMVERLPLFFVDTEGRGILWVQTPQISQPQFFYYLFFFFLVERKVCFISDASNFEGWGCVADVCLKSDSPGDKQGVGAFIDRVWGAGGYMQKQHSHL